MAGIKHVARRCVGRDALNNPRYQFVVLDGPRQVKPDYDQVRTYPFSSPMELPFAYSRFNSSSLNGSNLIIIELRPFFHRVPAFFILCSRYRLPSYQVFMHCSRICDSTWPTLLPIMHSCELLLCWWHLELRGDLSWIMSICIATLLYIDWAVSKSINTCLLVQRQHKEEMKWEAKKHYFSCTIELIGFTESKEEHFSPFLRSRYQRHPSGRPSLVQFSHGWVR